jgi:hypothetical protein
VISCHSRDICVACFAYVGIIRSTDGAMLQYSCWWLRPRLFSENDKVADWTGEWTLPSPSWHHSHGHMVSARAATARCRSMVRGPLHSRGWLWSTTQKERGNVHMWLYEQPRDMCLGFPLQGYEIRFESSVSRCHSDCLMMINFVGYSINYFPPCVIWIVAYLEWLIN